MKCLYLPALKNVFWLLWAEYQTHKRDSPHLVPGVKPSPGVGLRIGLGVVEVAGGHVRPSDANLPHLVEMTHVSTYLI